MITENQSHDAEEQEAQAIVEELRREGAIGAKMTDAEETPLFAATFDPDEAEEAGCFTEDAITPEEAGDAALDNR